MENIWLNVMRADAKRITRDWFLLLIFTYLPLLALAMRWAIPALAESVSESVDLIPYYPPLAAMLVLIIPYVMGCVLGLQMLEEKDEKSISALAVTTFSFRRYFISRVTMYATAGTIMLVAGHLAMGLVQSISLFHLCLVALALSLNTAMSAPVIAILAKNQVQGFAVLKISGIPFFLAVMSFFVPENWDLLFGVIPLYWPIKAYYIAVSGGPDWAFFGAVAVAVILQVVVIRVLYRIFVRSVLES